MNKNPISVIPRTLMLALALLSPGACYANHGLQALGEVLESLFIIMVVLLLVSFVVTIGNVYWKKRAVRVISIVLLLPQLLLIFLAFVTFPLVGIIAVAFFAIQVVLIYKSAGE
jgi:Ca2+/Na+ antiporter